MIVDALIAGSVAISRVTSPATTGAPAPTLSDAAHAIDVGRLDEARLLIGRMIAAGVKGPQVERLLADVNFASGHYAEANAEYRQLLVVNSSDPYLCERAGIGALKLGDIAGAAPMIACATAPTNASWRAWNARGVLSDLEGDWAAADEAFERASAIAPGRAEIVNNRGWSQLMRGNWQEATQLFAQAVSANPGNARMANNLELARAALASELPQRRAGESVQGWTARLNDVGLASQLLGDRKKAIAAFTQALEASGSWYERAANNLEAVPRGE